MRNYELMTIYNIELGEDAAKELSEEVKNIITSLEGEVVSDNFWGKRRFAYRIGTQEEGFYDVVQFDAEGSKIEELKAKLNLQDNIVRYLVTALE